MVSLCWLYKQHNETITGVTIRRVDATAFGGDCIDVANGVVNALVEDVRVSDWLRQGVDFAGNGLSRNYVARRITELPWAIVTAPGGGTVHVEEAVGFRGMLIEDCVAEHSIQASSVTANLTIQNNVIYGSLVANGDGAPTVVRNNTVHCGVSSAGDSVGTSRACVAMLAARGLVVERNTFLAPHPLPGVHLWGDAREGGFTEGATITDNDFVGKFVLGFRGRNFSGAVVLDGVDGVVVSGTNRFHSPNSGGGGSNVSVAANVCACCWYPEALKAKLCKGIVYG